MLYLEFNRAQRLMKVISKYMFENVTIFEQLHSKLAKSAKVTSKIIPFNKSNYGYQKSLNVMMISNSLKWAGENVPK